MKYRLAFISLLIATRVGAQQPDSAATLACGRTDNTERVDTTTANVVDREIRLDITERTWQRENLERGVAVGASGVAGTARAPWRACAGASVRLGRVTASLHNVRGLIRFHADLHALDSITTSLKRERR